MIRADRGDWKSEPLPDRHTTVRLDRLFSEEEMRLVERGVIPEQMEDKWFIFFEDDTLYCHRSWTGFCLYVVHFVREEKGCRATHAEVNRDPGQYCETDDDHDTDLIHHLIDVMLLGRMSVYPRRKDARKEEVLEQWSMMGRAMIPDGDSECDDRDGDDTSA